MTKTCGECRYFTRTNNYDMCAMYADFREESDCRLCEYFTQKVITNGDKIIAGGNKGLAAFACGLLNDRSEETFQRMLSFLNAPAESEKIQ